MAAPEAANWPTGAGRTGANWLLLAAAGGLGPAFRPAARLHGTARDLSRGPRGDSGDHRHPAQPALRPVPRDRHGAAGSGGAPGKPPCAREHHVRQVFALITVGLVADQARHAPDRLPLGRGTTFIAYILAGAFSLLDTAEFNLGYQALIRFSATLVVYLLIFNLLRTREQSASPSACPWP